MTARVFFRRWERCMPPCSRALAVFSCPRGMKALISDLWPVSPAHFSKAPQALPLTFPSRRSCPPVARRLWQKDRASGRLHPASAFKGSNYSNEPQRRCRDVWQVKCWALIFLYHNTITYQLHKLPWSTKACFYCFIHPPSVCIKSLHPVYSGGHCLAMKCRR